jgi:hypothetical protein
LFQSLTEKLIAKALVKKEEEFSMHQRNKSKAISSVARRKRFSPLMLVGLSVPVVLTLIASAVLILPHLGSRADVINGDCTLIVPPDPLSADGLAKPYLLQAPCSEANVNTQVFVQGAVFDPATKQISIYNPLVTDQEGAAIAPTVPKLPKNAVVALWFGFNGNNLTLTGAGATGCQQGMVQFAYCNAENFFAAVNNAGIAVPALGTGKDGLTCPTVRDFSIVDQDQSDNTPTTYLLTAGGQTAQNTAANRTALQTGKIFNPSDEKLLVAVDTALGCKPFTGSDLADNNAPAPALPLNELSAAALQGSPTAEVPAGDPFVGPNNITLVNRYRVGVDQNQINNISNANTAAYCNKILEIAPKRLNTDKQFTLQAASPLPDVANNLFTFLAQRLQFTFGENGLNCTGLLGVANPVQTTQDAGVVIDATIAT